MNSSHDLTRCIQEHVVSRRGFLSDSFHGLAGLGLASLFANEGLAATLAPRGENPDPWRPGQGVSQFLPRAKRVLQIFCPGAASHIDLWDYKPALAKYDGKPLPGEEVAVTFQGKSGNIMRSPWPF